MLIFLFNRKFGLSQKILWIISKHQLEPLWTDQADVLTAELMSKSVSVFNKKGLFCEWEKVTRVTGVTYKFKEIHIYYIYLRSRFTCLTTKLIDV